MKKILLLITLFFIGTWVSSAQENPINRADVFQFFARYYQDKTPESFQYIELKYTDIKKDTSLEDALQILMYLDLIQNKESRIFPDKQVDLYTLEKLSEKVLNLQLSSSQTDEEKKHILANTTNLQAILHLLEEKWINSQKKWATITITSWEKSTSISKKQAIFQDVYNTLDNSHYDRAQFTEDQLMEWAIKWLAEWVGDKYTTYFPPVDSNDFFEWLDGEYEGIGAYVDMPSPGSLIIVSPMVGSPALEAGLKWGDVITHVDDKEITENNSQREVISWIKGPAWTTVKLTLLREWEKSPLTISVKRAKIILKDVEYKKIDSKTFYIQIKSFWEHVDSEFKEAIDAIKEDRKIKKIIIDLRNNPGWYLTEVSNMLSHFIKKWEATAIVGYGSYDTSYKSLGFNSINLSDYKVIFLQNSWTASASEIMIGTIKDYYPEVTIIGEQSYGKGSVQSLKQYYDGSTLKFTSAKWFTGKTRNTIDGVWITPDILLEFDIDRFEKFKTDNQLEKAIKY